MKKIFKFIYLGAFIVGIFFILNVAKIVLADDEEEGEEYYYETELYAPVTESYSSRLSDEVTSRTTRTTIFDSDRDGIFDEKDKYPGINDFFIVKDDNLNGIVDKYE